MEESPKEWKIATILPGALLVAVACCQIYLTQTNELTPSKGGGFGMFAVTDIRNARAWSVECLTEDGKPCRLLIPRGEGALGQWLGEAFRTMPSAGARARAADRIFRGRYVISDYDSTFAGAKLQGMEDVLPAGWQDRPLYRPPSPEDLDRGLEPVKLEAIRFQAWRLTFDPASDVIRYEPIGDPEVRGEW